MDPLVEASFSTRNEVINAAQDHAMAHGYAVTTKRSCNRDRIVVLCCDRSGCPFEIRGELKNDNWHLTAKNPLHNHKPSTVPPAHPIQRRMPEQIRMQVKESTAAGIPARQIATAIRQRTDHPMVAEDIYNIQKQVRPEGLAGKIPTEAVVAAVDSGGDCPLSEDTHPHRHIHGQAATVAQPTVLEPATAIPKGYSSDRSQTPAPRQNRITKNRKVVPSTRREAPTLKRIPKLTDRAKTTRPKPTRRTQTTRQKGTTCKKGKDKAIPLDDSESGDGHDSAEDALMLRELERLKASGGRAPPLWATEPEFVGMSNATRAYAFREREE